MKNLAIIPARGGSKRIPRKNIRDFFGKPIIAYSIQAALSSGLFDEVMVSTDDDEIAEIARQYGAAVPFMRSENTSDDFATTSDVLIEVIESYKLQGRVFENVCCIYPAAPLIKSTHLTEGYEKLINEKRNSVFPVVAFSYPVQRGLIIDSEGRTNMLHPENASVRSQDLQKVYHDAGQWYWLNTESFLADKKIFSSNSASVILSETEVQDIDTLIDWKMAEFKYEYLQSLT
ncbi:MAG TPA: pseudaminic acid cytidylyltransferase [Bacteroidales bacterium]|nr:pseudaminic acid cytidylyltransferase [Bacteroidales bacterium]